MTLRSWDGALAALAAVLIWAGWIVWLRASVGFEDGGAEGVARLTPADVAFLRFAAPALLLAPVWLRPGLRAGLAPPGVPALTLLALFGWGAPFALLAGYGAAASSASLMAALTPGVMPLFAAAFAFLAYRTAPTPQRWVGLGFIAAAAALTTAPLIAEGGGALLAAALLLGAAASWAGFAVAFPKSGLSPVQAAGLVGGYSVLFLTPVLLVGGSQLGDLPLALLAREALLHGLLGGVVSILCYAHALRRLGASAATLSAAVPGLAGVFGWIFLDETAPLTLCMALVCATIGVALANAPTRLRPSERLRPPPAR